jgi:hypothetical protein
MPPHHPLARRYCMVPRKCPGCSEFHGPGAGDTTLSDEVGGRAGTIDLECAHQRLLLPR